MARFGAYELDGLLGRGGMAEAFLAHRHDDAARRPVVLKRIRADLAHHEEYLRRFTLEAQVASRLAHTNLVRFREFGRVGDCHYIVLDLVSGYSLHRILGPMFEAKKAPPLEVSLHIGLGIFSGLAEMHAVKDENGQPRPMLHRDVTPTNVIVNEKGDAVIIDFGITKDIHGPAITLPGKVIGTARYMAPEHRRAEYVEPSADVFSASVILYELVTGDHPWPPLDSLKELLRFTFEPPEISAAVRKRVPGDVLSVMLKGLECEASRRYPDAGAMATALRRCKTFPFVQAEGPKRTVEWLQTLGIDKDDHLGEPVLDLGNDQGEVVWSSVGTVSSSPQDAGTAPGPQGEARATVLTPPPLPPRRDAGLESQDIRVRKSKMVWVWSIAVIVLSLCVIGAAIVMARLS